MDRIGPYITERKLGTGGMGTVFLARHEETGEQAAVKLLPASLAREPGFLARFDREIVALQQLKNAHVVRIFDSGIIADEDDEENTAYYYAMEYVEGETLLNKLRREKRLGWRQAIDFGVQVCVALKSAHDAGIVHRDLKPSNLLISGDDQVKLADFGVAQIFASTRLTKTGGIIGTAEFMSPEQAQGHRATKKSDLYALGAVLYTMVTGKPPHSGPTMLDVLHKHQFGQYDSPRHFAPDCPSWLEEVIGQLLEKDPEKRPANAYVTGRRLREIPKKVDLSQSEPYGARQRTSETGRSVTEHVAGGHDDLLDSKYALPNDAPTRTAPGLTGQDDAAPRRGPGEATLMHSLMRAELTRQQQQHPVQKFFDNTWVLVGLLVVVLAGMWIFIASMPTPEEHYAEAQRLIAEGEYTAAEINHLDELLDEKGDWPAKAQALIEKSDRLQEQERAAQRGESRDAEGERPGSESPAAAIASQPAQSEAERLLRQATAYQGQGDTQRARRHLDALIQITAGDSDAADVRRAAEEFRASLPTSNTIDESRRGFIQEALTRAGQLRDDGKTEEAEALIRALEHLYQDDPAARKILGELRGTVPQQTSASE